MRIVDCGINWVSLREKKFEMKTVLWKGTAAPLLILYHLKRKQINVDGSQKSD